MTDQSKPIQPRVIVIDDERGPRESLRILLSREYRVECADSVDRGVEAIRRELPDIIIMDIRMPGKSGIDGLREIRKLDELVSVVMLTGYATIETAQQALRLGANDYVNKPFDTTEMMGVVKRYVQRTRIERKRLQMLLNLRDMNTRLAESLSERERLASMGQSSAEFAHDLRNPLMIVGGYVNLLSRQLGNVREMMGGEYTQVAEYLNVIEKNVQRCNDLSHMWQKLGKSDLGKFSPLTMGDLIDDLVMGVEPLACTTNVDMEYVIEARDAVIEGSRPQLLRAVHNVVANAIQAVEPGAGKVRIGIRQTEGEVELTVRDNGCGMTQEVLDRMFEPYFTTKEESKGTGLGMVITKKIVEEHHGRVEVQSRPGEGTQVTLRFPLSEELPVTVASSWKSATAGVAALTMLQLIQTRGM